jgi:DNA-directed RNA polymerase specialized sigma24 family protein
LAWREAHKSLCAARRNALQSFSPSLFWTSTFMSGPSRDSVSQWIAGLQAGDQEAIKRLWERYFEPVVAAARDRLGRAPRRVADEEDVAISVFDALCHAAAAGQHLFVKDRDDLWWLLLLMTKRKVAARIRSEATAKRGNLRIKGETEVTNDDGTEFDFDSLIGSTPEPEFMAVLDEQFHRLLNLLPTVRMRKVALLRMQGFEIEEIASRFGMTTRAVCRKIALIRAAWNEESLA